LPLNEAAIEGSSENRGVHSDFFVNDKGFLFFTGVDGDRLVRRARSSQLKRQVLPRIEKGLREAWSFIWSDDVGFVV
jgi:hypothetical protein